MSGPIGSVEELIVAIPLTTVEVPRTFEPLVKVTLPVTLEGTDAVKTTDWLAVEGLIEEEIVSVGDAFITV